jgi:uncharacterized repeat protein (TIGR01451 family)
MKITAKRILPLFMLFIWIIISQQTVLANPTITIVDSVSARYTSIVLNANGYPVISYYHDDDDDGNSDANLKVAVCYEPECDGSSGTPPTITTVDSTGVVGEYTSLALTANGYPIISYYDDTNSNLKVAVCYEPECDGSSGTPPTLTIVDNASASDTSLVLNASGFPIISYSNDDDLKVAVCYELECDGSSGTPPKLTIVDSANCCTTSLELNVSGFPVISYNSNDGLKVAVCYEPECDGSSGTPPTLTIVDNVSASGTSLVLNASGFPVISYSNDDDNDLKVAVCNNALCTTRTLTTVDSAGVVGWDSSLALTASGFPIISYFDFTNLALKVAACYHATCTISVFVSFNGAAFAGVESSLELNASGFPVISYFGDYALVVMTCKSVTCSSDFGDAPTAAQSGFAASYPTTLADNGAVHKIGGPYMGTAPPDGEADGQPGTFATGDDDNGTALGDEDAVTFSTLKAGGTGTSTITVGNCTGTCYIDAWMDFNQDGDWADASEQIFTDQAVTTGSNVPTFSIPVSATIGTTFARFRLSATIGGVTSYTGLADDGEVEDHQATIVKVKDKTQTTTQTVAVNQQEVVQASELEYITVSVDNIIPTGGDTVTYTIIAHNPKAIPLTQVVIYDVFDERFDNVQLVSTTHGSGSFVKRTLTVSGFTLQPNETATIIVSAQITKDYRAGDVIPNIAALESPDASVHVSNLVLVGDNVTGNDGDSTTVLLFPSELPNTGETPFWRDPVLLVLALSGLLILSGTGAVLWRRLW